MQTEAPASPAPASTFIKFGVGVIAALFGGLLVWSILAPIDGAVIASGRISVESNRKTVQHFQGGSIKEILVREGQLVAKGDVLIRLDDTISGANLGLVDGQLAELYARRARLIAERDGAEKISSPQGVAQVLSRPDFKNNFKGQEDLFNARATTRARKVLLLEERITQQNKRISGLRAQRAATASQLQLITDELVSVRSLYEKGFAPLTRLRALERESERLTGERGSLIAALAEADSIIAETKLEIERLKESAREEAITELRDAEVSIAELEERRITADHTNANTEIKAPQAGRVIGLSVHTIGGVIAPGESIMDIVPAGDRLEVVARVSPRDIEKVHAGQEAVIRFTAFSARRTPEATGSVRTVSADSLVDQVTGAPYYLIQIDLPSPE